MSAQQDHMIRKFHNRLFRLYLLKWTLVYATAWAFGWATIVLALRILLNLPAEPFFWGLLSLPLVLIPAVITARRQMPPKRNVRALLDQENACGGVLMAGEERALGGWSGSVRDLASPSARWKAGPCLGCLALGCAMLTGGYLAPQRFLRPGDPPLVVDREVERLNKQIDVLKEERILKRERADALKDRLKQVEEDATGNDPVKTLDALDHLDKVAKDAAKKAAEKAAQQTEELAKAEALADALRKHAESLSKKKKEGDNPDRLSKKKKGQGNQMDAKNLTRAMKELSRLTREAAKDKGLQKPLDKKLQEQLDRELSKGSKGNLDKDLLDKLAKELGQSKAEIIKKMKKLREVRLIDAEALKKCEGGKCDGEALAAMLAKNKDGKMTLGEMMARAMQRPGRGGVNRGRGDAPIIFGSKSPDKQKEFKESILPPARLAELKKSKMLGSTKVQPKVGNDGEVADSGGLADAKAGNGSAVKQLILPRHRRAVDQYFDRKGRKKE